MNLNEIKKIYPEIPIGKANNLTGQKSGELTALYRTENIGKKSAWVCKCSCGKYTKVRADNFQNGQKGIKGGTRSCGCLADKIFKNRNTVGVIQEDLSGTILQGWELIEKTDIKDSNRSFYYKIKCPHCGGLTYASIRHLKDGYVKQSCGCQGGNSLNEMFIANMLKERQISFQTEVILFENTRFDFFVENKYIIEFDGEQHFYNNTFFYKDEKEFLHRRELDLKKNQFCFINNIPIIRIPYDKSYDINDLFLDTTKFLLTPDNEEEYYQR